MKNFIKVLIFLILLPFALLAVGFTFVLVKAIIDYNNI